jgi:hypothetical protein
MRHRLGRGVVGLAVGLAAVCLLSLPASANTMNLEFIHLNTATSTPGNITIYNADEEVVEVIAIGSGTPTLTCSTDPTTSTAITATATGTATTGTFEIAFNNRCRAFTTGAGTTQVRWCEFLSGTLAGTYVNGTSTTSSNYTSASVDPPGFTAILRKNVGTTHNCHTVTTTFCTRNFSNLTVIGAISTHNLPTLAVSDEVTMTGTTNVGDMWVGGTAADCGLLVIANNGSFSINARVHVTH